jgi:hypothetical protein
MTFNVYVFTRKENLKIWTAFFLYTHIYFDAKQSLSVQHRQSTFECLWLGEKFELVTAHVRSQNRIMWRKEALLASGKATFNFTFCLHRQRAEAAHGGRSCMIHGYFELLL